MARKLREEVSDGLFHVYARGNGKAEIFLDEQDPAIYLGLLETVVEQSRWVCMAYCLMPNHVHLLLQTPNPNLGAGMQRLHGRYAQTFNSRHGRVGHLFQGRFGAVRINTDAQFATAVAYIATNPVAAGLVDRPDAWRWGSHRAIAGCEPAPRWLAVGRTEEMLAGAFGGDGADNYRELVAGRLDTGVAVTASEVMTGAGSGSTVL